MQQRLGLAQALIRDPPLLLLDEPTSALDPAGRRDVRELLVRLRERGTGVLLNSHLLSEVELVCDRVVLLVDGQVVKTGRPSAPRSGSRAATRSRSICTPWPWSASRAAGSRTSR
ncbi:MAG TPA: AAA family ATPase [Thermoleophilaceae bacterium]|nr:AAA family ATPase [Thermoleophilaceae bacterium]